MNWRDYYTEKGIKLKIVYYTKKKKKKIKRYRKVKEELNVNWICALSK